MNNRVSKYGSECSKCSITKTLTKHHLIKNRKNTGVIIALCKKCHNKLHGCEPKIKAKCPMCGMGRIMNVKGGDWGCRKCGFTNESRNVFLEQKGEIKMSENSLHRQGRVFDSKRGHRKNE